MLSAAVRNEVVLIYGTLQALHQTVAFTFGLWIHLLVLGAGGLR
ncbi:hypothetical protein [Mucilaginibacter pedocola]|nr:hypothetical protein [Mucilaginibacter pedocola]